MKSVKNIILVGLIGLSATTLYAETPKNRMNIEGQAFLKTGGGRTMTCAGEKISLYSLDDYLKILEAIPQKVIDDRRFLTAYDEAVRNRNMVEHAIEVQNVIGGFASKAETMCDANGNFILKNIPFGSYGIITDVHWFVGNELQGGSVGKRIEVNESLQNVFITETLQ